ncbi:FAD/NAD(P)-binding domain-containing protein [Laetiporus sulphureus 93-53]|uniref:FAD/NAD(P)-binding domain-containing protein n=1 Tax=Laetiporus sulphureus 93-53 TaxID=1314785 RepID=A0A165B9K3_9APHY|nr:FAD/NAD(P)-binding domain-containing protein [Laetiporus sulphureus 93-53]KZT00558.1 FAD/NAD(P)-binding domain-containing protein [Laetiporus sulphureus 93-53]
MSRKLTIAICGGGVGGLTCAVALSRNNNIQVDIYEAASRFAEIGAGIGVWPRGMRVLQALGLDRELANVAIVDPEERQKVVFEFRKGDQAEGQSFYTLKTPGGLTTFHRPDFQSVLLRHVPPSCRTHTNKRLVSYTQPPPNSRHPTPSPITLHFQDGTTATCDLLIGADGVRSSVRATLVRELAGAAMAEGRAREAEELRHADKALWSGICAYRATIPSDALRARIPGHRALREPLVYFGKDTQLTVYPVARGKIINFAAFRAQYSRENTTLDAPYIEEVPKEALLHEFRKWEPEVQALFQCVPKYSRWAIHVTPRLPTFVSGRVALLGDAAHAMLPFQGTGAGQAIEDGYLLAALLIHPRTTLSNLAQVLHIYDAVRRPVAQRAAAKAREASMLYTLNYPGLTPDHIENGHAAETLGAIADRIRENWVWQWETTLDDDVNRAIRMLEASCQ